MPIIKKIRIGAIGVLCLFLAGCSKDSFLLSEETHSAFVAMEAEAAEGEADAREAESKEAGAKEAESEETDARKAESVETGAGEGVKVDTKQETPLLCIHICGAVCQPGVFFLEEGHRICNAIELAGGLTKDADEEYLNQALLLEDGMQIVVPTREEVENLYVQFLASRSGTVNGGGGSGMTAQETDGKVNLNTADESLLQTLPGIGESRAKSIIDYRNKHGQFEKIEDIMKISGIKEAAFEKIKDLIFVS